MNITAHPTPICPYCGCWPHDRLELCPAIKSIEYFENGNIKKIEKKNSIFEQGLGKGKYDD